MTLQPILDRAGYSQHIPPQEIAIFLISALTFILLLRLLKANWPQVFMTFFIMEFVKYFGDPQYVFHIFSCICALGVISLSIYFFAMRKTHPKRPKTRKEKGLQWVVAILLYVALAYGIQKTMSIQRLRRQLIQKGWYNRPTYLLDLTTTTSGSVKHLALKGYSIAVPWPENTIATNQNDRFLQVLYDKGGGWLLYAPEKGPNLLAKITHDDTTPFLMPWFFSSLTAKDFYTELILSDPLSYLRPFQSLWTSLRLRTLFIIQGILIGDKPTYAFNHMNYSGFQFGSPGKDGICNLIFFDGNGNTYQASYFGKTNQPPVLDQHTMNRVIKSFRSE